ncbi:histidinol dehydrogenase [Chloroflexota bacterium]
MLIVEGFKEAEAMLSRQLTAVAAPDTPALRLRMKQIFGAEMGAEAAVMRIIDDVRNKGDDAIRHYTMKIDKINLDSLEVEREQVEDAYGEASSELVSALKLAAERIKAFHLAQKESICNEVRGEEWGQLVLPLARVGVYAPGGTASYPSTVLMTAIPAKVAGVKEIILVTPPGSNGKVPPSTLVAAGIAGVDRIFSIGGAQAIAALAFGTESVPKVDKICGPGNIFVVLAKKVVYGVVDIDGLQGPSEVLIIADETANPAYCAADLLAQAEHDMLSQAILVTTSRKLADEVNGEIKRQLNDLPRRDIAVQSLKDRGIITVVANLNEALDLANLYAPEHLELMVRDTSACIDRVNNAGCVFIGGNSTVAFGDYIAGPSHVLPTGGTARFSSPLNINDFIKFIDVVNISDDNLKKLGQAVKTIARAEGLEAHARAVEKRFELKNNY